MHYRCIREGVKDRGGARRECSRQGKQATRWHRRCLCHKEPRGWSQPAFFRRAFPSLKAVDARTSRNAGGVEVANYRTRDCRPHIDSLTGKRETNNTVLYNRPANRRPQMQYGGAPTQGPILDIALLAGHALQPSASAVLIGRRRGRPRHRPGMRTLGNRSQCGGRLVGWLAGEVGPAAASEARRLVGRSGLRLPHDLSSQARVGRESRAVRTFSPGVYKRHRYGPPVPTMFDTARDKVSRLPVPLYSSARPAWRRRVPLPATMRKSQSDHSEKDGRSLQRVIYPAFAPRKKRIMAEAAILENTEFGAFFCWIYNRRKYASTVRNQFIGSSVK